MADVRKQMRKGNQDYDAPFIDESPKGLRYRVPTKDREKDFARAAVQAAAAMGTHTATGRAKGVGEAAERGEPWQEGLMDVPVPKYTGLIGDGTKVILALALSAVLAKGVALLPSIGLKPSLPVVQRLEKLVSGGFQKRLGTPSRAGAGQGFQVNWAGELKTLLGGSAK